MRSILREKVRIKMEQEKKQKVRIQDLVAKQVEENGNDFEFTGSDGKKTVSVTIKGEELFLTIEGDETLSSMWQKAKPKKSINFLKVVWARLTKK